MAQKKDKTNESSNNGEDKKVNSKGKTNANGANQENGGSHSPSLSGFAILSCIVIAAVSFAVGLFTPPALSFKSAYETQQRKLTKDRTRKITPHQGTVNNLDPCSEQVLSQFIHDEPVKGMHYLCWKEKDILNLYREAVNTTLQETRLESDSWNDFSDTLERSFGMQPIENRQSWAIFSRHGEKLATADDKHVDMNKLKKEGFLVVMRGGQWLWPGVRIGFRRTIDLSKVPGLPPGRTAEKRNATLETLSLQPLVVSVEGFLSDEECDIIQQLATPKIKYSGVVLKDVDEGKPASDFRTSQSTFLSSGAHPALKDIDYRTAGLVRIPRTHQETVQVLRYGNEEFYAAHNDYFDPNDYKNDQNTLRLIENGRRNRLATVFWYLSDVSEGGHTCFPRFNNAPQPRDFKDCSKGLLVKPERGKVIIFYSLKADGELDELSLHGACAVKGDNVKWAANKWVWNAPMGYIHDT
jgi:prolyl 4-hydroxylase